LPQGQVRVHEDRRDADGRLALLESEGQRARADAGARGDDRGRDLRWPALSAAPVLVCERRGRALMPADGTLIEARRLTAAVARILAAVGIGTADAEVVASDLVEADLEGLASHGVMLLPMYVDRIAKGSVSRGSRGEVVSDRGTAIVIDAKNALGQLTARQAV